MRRGLPGLLTAVVVAVLVIGCGESNPLAPGAVEVAVTVEPDRVKLGEPIRARATVTNLSDGPVRITGIRQTLVYVDEDRAVFDDELEGELTVAAGETVTLIDGGLSFEQDLPLGGYALVLVVTGPRSLEAEDRATFVVELP